MVKALTSIFCSLAGSCVPQRLREETSNLEGKHKELEEEAAETIQDRTAELESLRARCAELSSQIEVGVAPTPIFYCCFVRPRFFLSSSGRPCSQFM